MVFDFLGKKAVIGMCHLGALPGSLLYDADAGTGKLIDDGIGEVEKLQAGGLDAILFGNENDRPYLLKVPPQSIAAMAAIISAVRQVLKIPFGVNYLWDPDASVCIAVAADRVARGVDGLSLACGRYTGFRPNHRPACRWLGLAKSCPKGRPSGAGFCQYRDDDRQCS